MQSMQGGEDSTAQYSYGKFVQLLLTKTMEHEQLSINYITPAGGIPKTNESCCICKTNGQQEPDFVYFYIQRRQWRSIKFSCLAYDDVQNQMEDAASNTTADGRSMCFFLMQYDPEGGDFSLKDIYDVLDLTPQDETYLQTANTARPLRWYLFPIYLLYFVYAVVVVYVISKLWILTCCFGCTVRTDEELSDLVDYMLTTIPSCGCRPANYVIRRRNFAALNTLIAEQGGISNILERKKINKRSILLPLMYQANQKERASRIAAINHGDNVSTTALGREESGSTMA